jgi:type IV secretory pathway VirB4 component
MKDRMIRKDTESEQKIINNWALSVIQRLEREDPETFKKFLNQDKEVQQDANRR